MNLVSRTDDEQPVSGIQANTRIDCGARGYWCRDYARLPELMHECPQLSLAMVLLRA